jgi:hypothetical protein
MTGKRKVWKLGLEIGISERGKFVSMGNARKIVSDDVFLAMDVRGLNADVGKHQELRKNASQGAALGGLHAGDFLGSGLGGHVVGPEEQNGMRRAGGGGKGFPCNDSTGESKNESCVLQKVDG